MSWVSGLSRVRTGPKTQRIGVDIFGDEKSRMLVYEVVGWGS